LRPRRTPQTGRAIRSIRFGQRAGPHAKFGVDRLEELHWNETVKERCCLRSSLVSSS